MVKFPTRVLGNMGPKRKHGKLILKPPLDTFKHNPMDVWMSMVTDGLTEQNLH